MKITADMTLIAVDTGQYPLNLTQVRAILTEKSFAEEPDEELLADLGYGVVHPEDPPAGDVAEEGAPALQDGLWVQTWTVRPYNTEEIAANFANRKAELNYQIEALIDATLDAGCVYTFPSGDVQHIQLRDGDRANLVGLAAKADRVQRAGGEQTFYFRTQENDIQAMTTAQTVVMTDVAFDKYMFILNACWPLKDQIKTATDLAGLPTIPTSIEV